MDLEQHRLKLTTKWKWIIGALAGLIVSPVILVTIQGMLGLIAAFAIGTLAVNFAPYFAMRVANLKMKAITAEANANPIETMKNLRIDREKDLELADKHITDFDAELAGFDEEIKEFAAEYPEEAPTYQKISGKMHQLLDVKIAAYEQAQKEVEDLKQRTRKAESIYKMAMSAKAITESAQDAEARVFAEIKEKVAFGAVTKQMNLSFANLNKALRDRPQIPTLAAAKENA